MKDRSPGPEIIPYCGMEKIVAQGLVAIPWGIKMEMRPGAGWRLHSTNAPVIGVAMVMQETAIPYLDMGGASIKMNDDGSFNLLLGATDLGTGSDTVLAQMAAEVLVCHSRT